MARVLFSGRISARREVFPADLYVTLRCPKNVQKSVFFACFFALFFRHVGGGGAAAPRGTIFAPSPSPDLGKTQSTTAQRQKTACKLRDFRAVFLASTTHPPYMNYPAIDVRIRREHTYQLVYTTTVANYPVPTRCGGGAPTAAAPAQGGAGRRRCRA